MMAMKVLIRDKKTIRMNLAVCKSSNADFDGDEINIRMLSNEAQTELFLSSAKCNIISPQSINLTWLLFKTLYCAYKMTLGFEKSHYTGTQYFNGLI